MNPTITSILRSYIICATWLAVALGMGFAFLGPVDAMLEPLGASAVVRGVTAMSMGVVAGVIVAWMIWTSFPVRRAPRAKEERWQSAPLASASSSGRS